MKISKIVYQSLIGNCSCNSESGGILGLTSNIITHYQFDTPIDLSEYYYRPNTQNLNLIISKWQECEITFAGIFHSHPTGITSLSFGDESYIKDIMQAVSLSPLYFPIIAPRKGMKFYKATFKNDTTIITNEEVEIV